MKTVLITGGSSGIGFEMSKQWAKRGYRILWVSLLEEELQSAKKQMESEFNGIQIEYLQKDLSLENAPEEILNWSKSKGQIDVLINNAGFGNYGYLQDIPLDKEIKMIQLNVMSLYKMTRLFLDEMLKQNKGSIINISSNSAFQPVARMSTYASTKSFVYQFSQGLQEELKLQKSPVKVFTVCPAAIKDTPFKKGMENVKTFDGLATTTALEVAQNVWDGFEKGQTFIVCGRKMRMLYKIRNFIPNPVQQYLVRRETEKK